jgi:hypothetical protein
MTMKTALEEEKNEAFAVPALFCLVLFLLGAIEEGIGEVGRKLGVEEGVSVVRTTTIEVGNSDDGS